MGILTAITHSHLFHGAVAGVLIAAKVDYSAFRDWKSFHDVATYNWSTALWRWTQGAIIGMATAAAAEQMVPDLAMFGA